MTFKVHFISGLPRAGSTLLSAILKQNPRFYARMTSPVAALIGAVQPKISGGEFSGFFDDSRRADVITSLFESYYARILKEMPSDSVVFDTNRTWTGRAALTRALFPKSTIVCCVREIGWILNSVEQMLNKNPLQLSKVFMFQPGSSVYGRVESLMNSENGLVGLAWSNLREAWFGRDSGRLVLIQYDNLVRDPETVISKLYTILKEPQFKHDFDNVIYEELDYDSEIGMPGLHSVRKKVEFRAGRPIIPPDLFAKYASAKFWEKPELNPNNVTVL